MLRRMLNAIWLGFLLAPELGTSTGLSLDVGLPAINLTPRAMVTAAVGFHGNDPLTYAAVGPITCRRWIGRCAGWRRRPPSCRS